jgi:hypothetical protein
MKSSVKQEGLLLVREGGDIFFVRYDIIFAKAGDVFFMPRKVPKDFVINSETILSKEEQKLYEHQLTGI